MTDTNKIDGWIFFDADCGLCQTLARRWGPLLRRHRFELLPLQTPWVRERLGVTDEELLREMRLLTPPGAVYGGADALLEIARVIWWARPVYWLSSIPLVTPSLRRAYRWVAKRRHCLSGGCRICCPVQGIPAVGDDVRTGETRNPSGTRPTNGARDVPARSGVECNRSLQTLRARTPTAGVLRAGTCRAPFIGSVTAPEIRDSLRRLLQRIKTPALSMRWAPIAVLPISAVIWGRTLPGWIWMWVIALALFFAAKWITLSRMLLAKEKVNPRRLMAYTLLWPGMDARAFCGKGIVPAPPFREWLVAAAKSIFGAALLLWGVPLANATHPLAAGWVGMVGLVLLLHFGSFHLVSLFWRALGIDAKPIMQSPLRATSLGKFWSVSWNTAFSDLMRNHLVKPLTRHFGAGGAFLTIFLISGALHELVLSLPARGGYGLPTLYFLLQGLGLLFERSKVGRRIGLGSGWMGWSFVALISGPPAFFLFHPPFVHNVILPMLRALGAT